MLLICIALLMKLQETINEIELSAANERIFNGDYIIDLFQKIGVTFQNSEDFIKMCENAVTLLSQGMI